MAFLYLSEQGAVLKKSSERLVVEKDEQLLLEAPVLQVDGVLIFGHIQVTTPALRLLLEHGLELALFTRRGRFLGRLSSPASKNIALRRAQYDRAGDPAFSLALARTIVAGKLANCLELVKRYARNHPDPLLEEKISGLQDYLKLTAAQPDLDSLMGLEGAAARLYFEALAAMLRQPLGFSGRRRRPAPDPVNALLNLGYTLVFNELLGLLDGLGLDPYLGFYHQPRYGHATLASDLLEEFRAPLVDRLTLNLLNHRTLKPQDFYRHPAGGFYLKDEPRKRYFLEYEKYLTRPRSCPDEEEDTDFRRLLRRQSERLRRLLLGQSPHYQPVKLSW